MYNIVLLMYNIVLLATIRGSLPITGDLGCSDSKAMRHVCTKMKYQAAVLLSRSRFLWGKWGFYVHEYTYIILTHSIFEDNFSKFICLMGLFMYLDVPSDEIL